MRRDLIIVAATVVLAAGYLFATFNLQTVPIGDPLGPKAYPAMLGLALLIAAAMIFLETRRAAVNVREGAEAAEEITILPSGKVMGAIAGTLVFIALFEPLGYLISSSLYLFGLMFVFHPGKHKTNAAVAILFTVGSYVLFQHLLSVSLPPGLLGF